MSSTPTNPAAVRGVYAVMVKDFLVEGGPTYTVSLVGTDGRTAATATARKRITGVQIGNLSTSATTLYYLDGDSEIHFLRADGATGVATRITMGAHQVAVFAVSPDDRRIAVSVLDYTTYPVSTRLFVEDLNGGGNHVELFSSPTVLEWPAGWHNGSLVVALGINARPQNIYEGFERGSGYHVADAQTGNRIRTLCDGGSSYVPESPAGTVCVQYPKASVVTWDGASRPVPMEGMCTFWGPLSPAGIMASRNTRLPDGGCTGGDSTYLIGVDGVQDHSKALAPHAAPEGWIDGAHVVVAADLPPLSPGGVSPASSVLNITTGALAAIQAPGFFAAALPGGL